MDGNGDGKAGNPNIKKYQLYAIEPRFIEFPENAVYVEKDITTVTVHMEEPDVITSIMFPVPPSWKGKSIKFNGYAAL